MKARRSSFLMILFLSLVLTGLPVAAGEPTGNPPAGEEEDQRGSEDQKTEEQKAEDQKADVQKAEDQKAEDQKAEDQKAEDQKADAQEGDGSEIEDLISLDIEDLLEIKVVTASKKAEVVEFAPSIVTVFTRADIEHLGARRLIDLLRLTPGFVEVSAPMERNIASRGVHANTSQNVVVLIDGLRMNDFLTNTAAPDGFLLDIAERVEIIRGPGAALYGANALTGVVNIITPHASEAPALLAEVGYGINDTLHLRLQKANKFDDGSGLLLSAALLQSHGTRHMVGGAEDVLLPRLGQNTSDGIQDGENLTLPRPSNPVWVNHYGPGFEGLFKYERPDDWTFRAGVGHKQFHPQRGTSQTLLDVVAQSQRPTRSDTRVTLDVTKAWGTRDGWGRITIRPALQYFRHEQSSQIIAEAFYDRAAEQERDAIISWSGEEARFRFMLEYARDFGEVAFIDDLSVLAGVSAMYDMAFNYRLTTCRADPENDYPPSAYDEEATDHDYVCFRGAPMLDEGTAVDRWGNRIYRDISYLGNGDDINFGGFVHVNGNLPWDLNLTLGARVDYNTEYDPVFTPRVALVKNFEKLFYVKALYSSAFVYPPFLFRTGNRQAGMVGNPDMVPESIQTFELLLGFRNSMMRVEINGYYNMVSDFITYDDEHLAQTHEYLYDNVGDLYILGVEGTATLRLLEGRLSTTLAAGYSMPVDPTDEIFLEDDDLAGPVKYPPFFASLVINGVPWSPLNINLSAIYLSPSKFRLAEGSRFVGVLGTNDHLFSTKEPGKYDTGLVLVNAHITYSFLEHWTASLSGRNLLGSVFRMTGATLVPYLTEGRQVVLGLAYRH